jgi:ArsR family transcriptional regulator
MVRPIDPLVLRRCGAALRTLAHPERLRVVELLERRARSVGELTEVLRRPQATISQHLMRLRAHGLVKADRRGREVRYAIAQPGCLSILGCIRTHFAKSR